MGRSTGNLTGDFDKMGGFGSGGWNWSGRPTTAGALRLEVNELNKSGALAPGCQSTSSWSRGGEQIGTINICAAEGGITLVYRSRAGGEEWADHREQIAISWEPCRFGGRRPYFHCPSCRRRLLYLYGFRRFLCRTCHGLAYPSQRERESDRAQRKANRIRVRLGGEPGWQRIPPRPKGMHRRTYDRLVSDIVVADSITDDAAIRVLARLQRTVQLGSRGFWS